MEYSLGGPIEIFKSKLDINLITAIKHKSLKEYRVIIHLNNLQSNMEKKILNMNGTILQSIPMVNCICSLLTPSALVKITEFPEVDFITFDSFAYACGESVLLSNKVYYKDRYKLTGSNIGVGIVDTGVYPHQDLLQPTNRIAFFKDLINKYRYPYDDNGHGTFISGIISGSGYMSNGLYKGVAERSHICLIKALNSLGRGYVSDILYGIELLIEEKDNYNIRVICLPFELQSYDNNILSLFNDMFNKAIEAKMIVLVPSGSLGPQKSSMLGIGTLKSCITVAGLNTNRTMSIFKNSSAGPVGIEDKPNLSAAASEICSINTDASFIPEIKNRKLYTKPLTQPYTTYSGTSCAVAFISGICALLLENNPLLTFKDMLSIFRLASEEIKDIPSWQQGWGMIDMNKLLP